MEVISGEKIVKSYGKFKVLKGINLNVQDGEFVGIMGKSVVISMSAVLPEPRPVRTTLIRRMT